MNSWFSDECPKCDSTNFVDGGPIDDDTYFTPEGICCWNCKTQWSYDNNHEEEDEDDPYYEDGIHFVRMYGDTIS